jgi:hypothetical protein
MRLTIYKFKELITFIGLCLFLTGLFHFGWTVLCFMIDIPRGY